MSTMWMIDTGYGGPALARSVEENNYSQPRDEVYRVSLDHI